MQECGHCSCLRKYSHPAREGSEGVLTDIVREADVMKGRRCPRGGGSDKAFALKNSVMLYTLKMLEDVGS